MTGCTPSSRRLTRAITEEVQALGEIELRGNITPQIWFKKLRTASGNTDFIACCVLAEIVYWYRRSANGGRRFNGALLQKSYQDLANTFGCNKHQIINAVIRLEKAGLIRRDFRTVETATGVANNVLYIQIFPEAIAKLSYKICAPLPINSRGPTDESRGTSPSIHGDKYIDYPKEYPVKAEQIESLPGLFSFSSEEEAFRYTRETIEAAFGGQILNPAEIRDLEEQVRKGRCCPVWAEGFRKAKKVFDANRAAYRGKAFIPVAPRHLSPNFDKVHEAVHDILAKHCLDLELRMTPPIDMECAEAAFAKMDDFLRRHGAINLLGVDFMNAAACVRIAFAYRKGLDEYPALRQTLLNLAQRELQSSPDALEKLGFSASEIRTVFELDQNELYQAMEAFAVRVQQELESFDAFFEIYGKKSKS